MGANKTQQVADKTAEVATATLQEAEAVKEQVTYTARQVQLSEEALSAGTQPWLTWEPTWQPAPMQPAYPGDTALWIVDGEVPGVEIRDDGSGPVGFIAVRNVGNGLALIKAEWCYVRGYDERHYGGPTTTTPVLPRNDKAALTFKIGKASGAAVGVTVDRIVGRPTTNGQFSIDVAYTDAAGVAATTARFKIVSMYGGHDWHVSEIEYYINSASVQVGQQPSFTVKVQPW